MTSSQPDRPIYLDHHATTPVDARVLDAMWPWFHERFGNAGSINHRYGQEAAEAVATARSEIAALLSADSRSLIFTSGATEANNLAIKGVLWAAGEGSHVVTSEAEHRAVLDPVRRLQRSGFGATILPVDSSGAVDPAAVEAAITPRTALVSLMLANNEIGTLNPIDDIGRICRRKGVWLHTDATQAVGHVPVDLSSLPVDLLSASAHKLYGPKGVGILFVRKGPRRIRMEPLLDGGGQEQRLRSGTLPAPLIVGFGEACRIAAREMSAESARIRPLRDRLQQRLEEAIRGIIVNGSPSQRLDGNLNVSIPGVDGEALMTSLTRIAVSSGSACTSADPEPSHVLRAIGRSDALTRASLRFGIGRDNTAEEIETAADEVIAAVTRLREFKTRW